LRAISADLFSSADIVGAAPLGAAPNAGWGHTERRARTIASGSQRAPNRRYV